MFSGARRVRSRRRPQRPVEIELQHPEGVRAEFKRAKIGTASDDLWLSRTIEFHRDAAVPAKYPRTVCGLAGAGASAPPAKFELCDPLKGNLHFPLGVTTASVLVMHGIQPANQPVVVGKAKENLAFLQISRSTFLHPSVPFRDLHFAEF